MAAHQLPVQWLDKTTSDQLGAVTDLSSLNVAEYPTALTNTLLGAQSLGLDHITNGSDDFVSYGSNSIALIILNRTGSTLTAKTSVSSGELTFEPPKSLAPPPTELGEGYSTAGLWLATQDFNWRRNPTLTVKVDATSATGDQPVYVCGDITAPLLAGLHYSVSARNDADHGDGDAYADTFIGSGKEYENTLSSSGHVSAAGISGDAYDMLKLNPPHEQTRMGPGVRVYQPWWLIVAVIS